MSTSAPAVNERLAALTEAGTSIWLDQIRRTLITDGELQRLVDESSLRGVTSNPAIFEKAILGSPDYDEQLEELARGGQAAPRTSTTGSRSPTCSWRATSCARSGRPPTHVDGYVSLEVNPPWRATASARWRRPSGCGPRSTART